MKALLPVYCRPLGYFVIALALFLPFLMLMMGRVTDANLLFYKECAKLLMMMGCLMIIFALTKNETEETVAQPGYAQRHVPDRDLHLRRNALSGGQRRHCFGRYFLLSYLFDIECALPGIWYKKSGS